MVGAGFMTWSFPLSFSSKVMATPLLANCSYFRQPVDYSWSECRMRVWQGAGDICLQTGMKPKQPTFLHLYYHGTMPCDGWAGVEYVAGMLNSLVHVFMYLYYGLARLWPPMWPYLWWKRCLTTLQLGQFVATAASSSYSLLNSPFPDEFNMSVLL
ncbi:hypothetical protein P7K49_019142 [Saguinus oedipus]|uniref:Elongation of very long chain fatty acids protein n=1 Tax=Saguinus oedipus TaxID=9490 RepID=A0ABQ9UWT0_SAGOE|nr:hypothetical protein P7K49_019142 [Saguinus oedipus]